jgi:hypothetical protein
MKKHRLVLNLSRGEFLALTRWADDQLESPATRAEQVVRDALRAAGRLSADEPAPPGSGPYRSG